MKRDVEYQDRAMRGTMPASNLQPNRTLLAALSIGDSKYHVACGALGHRDASNDRAASFIIDGTSRGVVPGYR